jgi:segregation and condensation protein B
MENEPVEEKTLSRISGLSKEVVQTVLAKIQEHYQESAHGIALDHVDGSWHFVPKRHLWEQLKERYGRKSDGKLSRAALETLSIIAYSQPITRGELDGIRGVSSDGIMRLLLARNLIHEVGKKDAPGRPVQYGTTKEFLRVFRLSSLADLPKLDELEKQRFELN